MQNVSTLDTQRVKLLDNMAKFDGGAIYFKGITPDAGKGQGGTGLLAHVLPHEGCSRQSL